MKNIFAIITVFISCVVYGQEKITVGDLLPNIFYTKQHLVDHYQNQKLSYEAVIHDIENQSGEDSKIISRDSNQIIYTKTNSASPDTITYVLTFNPKGQLIKWASDLNDCYDRQGSDIPEPVISNAYCTYNRIGQIEQITGHCANKEFSIQHNYFYNQKNKLDSILFREGYVNLNAYQKIIFADTTVSSGELKSSMVFILNTTFDYKEWLKPEPEAPVYSGDGQKTRRVSSIISRSGNEPGNNYVYEFDSLGRITSLVVLDSDARHNTLSTPNGCDFCEVNCESPSIFEFYYENDKIAAVELTSFDRPGSAIHCRCQCLIRITYRKEKIKEITYHAGLYNDYPYLVPVKRWTKRKGFRDIHENADNSKE